MERRKALNPHIYMAAHRERVSRPHYKRSAERDYAWLWAGTAITFSMLGALVAMMVMA